MRAIGILLALSFVGTAVADFQPLSWTNDAFAGSGSDSDYGGPGGFFSSLTVSADGASSSSTLMGGALSYTHSFTLSSGIDDDSGLASSAFFYQAAEFSIDSPTSLLINGSLGSLLGNGQANVFWRLESEDGDLFGEGSYSTFDTDYQIVALPFELPDILVGLSPGTYTFYLSGELQSEGDISGTMELSFLVPSPDSWLLGLLGIGFLAVRRSVLR
ncbi:MAG: hypothetical protein AMXMBFR47_32230 [Planctomycetota bacterium]